MTAYAFEDLAPGLVVDLGSTTVDREEMPGTEARGACVAGGGG